MGILWNDTIGYKMQPTNASKTSPPYFQQCGMCDQQSLR